MANLQGEVVAHIHVQPFELNPQMPVGGQDISEHLGLTIATAIVFYDIDGLHVSLDYDGDGTSDHRVDFDNSPFEMSSSDFLITDFTGTTDPFFPA